MNTAKILVNLSTFIEFSYFPGVQGKWAGEVKFQFLLFWQKRRLVNYDYVLSWNVFFPHFSWFKVEKYDLKLKFWRKLIYFGSGPPVPKGVQAVFIVQESRMRIFESSQVPKLPNFSYSYSRKFDFRKKRQKLKFHQSGPLNLDTWEFWKFDESRQIYQNFGCIHWNSV